MDKKPTLKTVIELRYSNKYRGHQLMIRVQYNRSQKKDIRLGIYLPELELFDSVAGKVKRTQKVEYAKINQIIIKKLAELSASENIMSVNDEANKLDLIIEVERLRKKYEIEESHNTMRFYYYTHKHLTEFFRNSKKDVKLNIRNIDDIFLDDFVGYLKKNYKLKSITIGGYLQVMSTVFNIIMKRNNTKIFSPFTTYKLKKDEEDFTTLTKADLLYFQSYVPKSPPRIMYKNLCMFNFFTQGTRISDNILAQWKNIITIGDNFYFKFRSTKTNKLHNIRLNDNAILLLRFFLDDNIKDEFLDGTLDDELHAYLNHKDVTNEGVSFTKRIELLKDLILKQIKTNSTKCIFHSTEVTTLNKTQKLQLVATKTSNVNKSLKTIREEEEYTNGAHLSTHSFRHLFSIIYYTKNRDIYSLSKLLYHSSVLITEEYLKRINVDLINEDEIVTFYDKL